MFVWRHGRRVRCYRLAAYVAVIWNRNGQILGEHDLCDGHQRQLAKKDVRFVREQKEAEGL